MKTACVNDQNQSKITISLVGREDVKTYVCFGN